ncbi:MAG: methyltransferase domain-containing protein [Planctomycetota bacterium]
MEANDFTIDDLDAIKPILPHDDLLFDELAAAYNFRNVSDRSRLFARLIIKELQHRPSPRGVVDAGCGLGLGRGKQAQDYVRAIAAHCEQYFGVEPDPDVKPTHGCFDQLQHALFEESELPTEQFDVVYSFLVMEHVTDPVPFVETAYRALKPGGVFIFMTMNQRHYFTRIASALHRLKIDEPVLRMVHGKKTENYHYPVAYRFNHPKIIDQVAERVGFESPQYAYTEVKGPVSYFPGPLRLFYNWRLRSRQNRKAPERLLEIYGRMVKPVNQ